MILLSSPLKNDHLETTVTIFFLEIEIITTNMVNSTEGKNQALVGAIPFCGEYPGPRFEDKFRSANQIDGISIADGGKMADS